MAIDLTNGGYNYWKMIAQGEPQVDTILATFHPISVQFDAICESIWGEWGFSGGKDMV